MKQNEIIVEQEDNFSEIMIAAKEGVEPSWKLLIGKGFLRHYCLLLEMKASQSNKLPRS